MRIFGKVRHRPSASWRQATDRAFTLIGDGRYEDAGALLTRAADLEPWLSESWFNLALLHKFRHDWEQARAAGLRAVALLDREAGAPDWWNVGIAATALQDWPLARRAWQAYGLRVPGSGAQRGGRRRADRHGAGQRRRAALARGRGRGGLGPPARPGPDRGAVASRCRPPAAAGARSCCTTACRTASGPRRPGPSLPGLRRDRAVGAVARAHLGGAAGGRAPRPTGTRWSGWRPDAGFAAEDWSSSVRLLCRTCSESRMPSDEGDGEHLDPHDHSEPGHPGPLGPPHGGPGPVGAGARVRHRGARPGWCAGCWTAGSPTARTAASGGISKRSAEPVPVGCTGTESGAVSRIRVAGRRTADMSQQETDEQIGVDDDGFVVRHRGLRGARAAHRERGTVPPDHGRRQPGAAQGVQGRHRVRRRAGRADRRHVRQPADRRGRRPRREPDRRGPQGLRLRLPGRRRRPARRRRLQPGAGGTAARAARSWTTPTRAACPCPTAYASLARPDYAVVRGQDAAGQRRSRSGAPATSRAASSTRRTTCTATSTSTGSRSGTARTPCGRWPRARRATRSSRTTDCPLPVRRRALAAGGALAPWPGALRADEGISSTQRYPSA